MRTSHAPVANTTPPGVSGAAALERCDQVADPANGASEITGHGIGRASFDDARNLLSRLRV